jgi:hypothetical protein
MTVFKFFCLVFILLFYSCKQAERNSLNPVSPENNSPQIVAVKDNPIPRSAVRIRGEVLTISPSDDQQNALLLRVMISEVIGYGPNFRSFMVRNGEVLEIRALINGNKFTPNEERVLDVITMPERNGYRKYQKAVLIEVVQ